MKIKKVKESNNKEKLQKQIKYLNYELLFCRGLIFSGVPLSLINLGTAIQGDNRALLMRSIVFLWLYMVIHFHNKNTNFELAKLEDQLEEIEIAEESIGRSLSR